MSASGRAGPLSLRARLLVLLIAVTAAFLLIMGAVSVAVLKRQLSGQFNADLVAAASRNPGRWPATPTATWPPPSPAAPGRSCCSPPASAAASSSRRSAR